MTQPSLVDTKVTEEAAKLGGTGAEVGLGVAEVTSGPEVPEADGRTEPAVFCCTGVVEPDTAAGAPPTCLDCTSCGTTIAAATTTAAAPAAMAACPSLRRRARFLIWSKVPGRGSKGVTRSSSQVSMSSRGSSMGFPSTARSLARAWCKSALTVPSGRPSISATSLTGNPA
jgi:hypothetical protein